MNYAMLENLLVGYISNSRGQSVAEQLSLGDEEEDFARKNRNALEYIKSDLMGLVNNLLFSDKATAAIESYLRELNNYLEDYIQESN